MTKMIIPRRPQTEVYRNQKNQIAIRQVDDNTRSDDCVLLDSEHAICVATWIQIVADDIRNNPDNEEAAS